MLKKIFVLSAVMVFCLIINYKATAQLDPTPVPTPATWAQPPQNNQITFEQYHQLPDNLKKDYELYYLTASYENDPKFHSLQEIPGWSRDLEWSATKVMEKLGFPSQEEIGFWGSCPETADETKLSLDEGKKNFMNKYYPKTPPSDAGYVPPNYDDVYRKRNQTFGWDYSVEVNRVDFTDTGINLPAVHQLVKVFPNGNKYFADDESFAFDPWAVGDPEVIPWKEAEERTYCYYGETYKRKKFLWETMPGATDDQKDNPEYRPKKDNLPGYNRDKPDDNVNVGRFSAPKTSYELSELRDSFIRLARNKGASDFADVWQNYPENLIMGRDSEPGAYFHPVRLFYLNYAAPMLLSRIGNSAYEYIKLLHSIPEIAILEGGYYENMSSLLAEYGIPSSIIGQDELFTSLKNYKALIISSGGLLNYYKSEFFHQALDDYLKAGGTIIVLAQAKGSHFNIIPGAENITALGWQEDQSCFSNSTRIAFAHPVIASQGSDVFDMPVDGLFLKWENYMTPILLRTKTPSPLMLSYDYENGKVILCTSFSDWAFMSRITNVNYFNFIRDLCLWGLYSKTNMKSAKPGTALSVPVELKNTYTKTISRIAFQPVGITGITYGSPVDMNLSIAPGETVTVNVNLTTPADAGIYQIDAKIFFADNTNLTQYGVAAFASMEVFYLNEGVVDGSGIYASLSTDAEIYAAGSTVHCTAHLWNTTAVDSVQNIKVYVPYQQQTTPYEIKNVTIPAHGSSVSYNFDIPTRDTSQASLLACELHVDTTSGQSTTTIFKYIRYTQTPMVKCNVSLLVSPGFAAQNSDAGIEVDIDKDYANSANDTWLFNLTIKNPEGTIVHTESFGSSPQPASFKHTTSWHIPADAKTGSYTVTCSGTFQTYSAGTSSLFNVTKGFLSYLTTTDGSWIIRGGEFKKLNANISSLMDTGFSGSARISIPGFGYDQTVPVSLAGKESAALEFTIYAPPDIAAGKYPVTLEVSDGVNKDITESNLSVAKPVLTFTLDDNEINAGDNISVTAKNTGGSKTGEMTYLVKLTSRNLTITEFYSSLNLNPDVYTLIIFTSGADLASGDYIVSVSYELFPGVKQEFKANLKINGASGEVTASTNKPVYASSETVNLSADYSVTGNPLQDGKMVFTIYDNSGNFTRFANREGIRKDAARTAIAANGNVVVYGPEMGIKVYNDTHKYITGWGDIWFDEEPMLTGDVEFSSANKLYVLNSDKNRIEIYAIGTNSHTLENTWDLRNPGGIPSTAMTMGADDRVYVARAGATSKTDSAYIEIYSAAGVFEKQVGSYGTGDGQFINPTHLKVDSGGNIYLCDKGNLRAIEIDNSGNHLLAFNIESRLPSGIGLYNGSTYILTDDVAQAVNIDYIYVFNSSGVQTKKSSIYLVGARDMAQTGATPPFFAVLNAATIYGGELNFLTSDLYNAAGAKIPGLKLISSIHRYADGSMLILDRSASVIWKYTQEHLLHEFLGVTLAVDLAVDSGGNIYYSTASGNNIRILNDSGTQTGTFPSSGPFAAAPSQICFDSSGYLYVYFDTLEKVSKYNITTGEELMTFNLPAAYDGLDMLVDKSGNIWLTGIGRLKKYSAAGDHLADFYEYGFSFALAQDPDGYIYMTNGTGKFICKFDENGKIKEYFDYSYLAPAYILAMQIADGKIFVGLNQTYGLAYSKSVPTYTKEIALTNPKTAVINDSVPANQHIGRQIFTADLFNRYGQKVATDLTHFLVSDSAVVLNIKTDKPAYKLNDDMAIITLIVTNNSGAQTSDTLKLKYAYQNTFVDVWSQAVVLENGESEDITLPFPTVYNSG